MNTFKSLRVSPEVWRAAKRKAGAQGISIKKFLENELLKEECGEFERRGRMRGLF